jgi:ADP-ribosyl-[dinitrogen reductase] hydrolase
MIPHTDARRDRAIGALLGLAIGDAVGTTLEFTRRDDHLPLTDMIGGGPFALAAGEWTDDTSMALCLAESLLAHPHLDQGDLMRRFVSWWRWGQNSHNGACFDIGITTAEALGRFERTSDPVAGSTAPSTAGNGSLMRLSPVAVRWHRNKAEAADVAQRQSVTTHGAPEAVDACRFFVGLLVDAVSGREPASLLSPNSFEGERKIVEIAQGKWRDKQRHEIASSGYVVDTLEAALWCIARSENFESAILAAANLADDADSVAAVTGQLAGAIWGATAIPEHWRKRLAWHDRIQSLADDLYQRGLSDG